MKTWTKDELKDILDSVNFENDYAKNCGYEDKSCTLREYLWALMNKLWIEGEGFSGKRPWGNSDWQHVVYKALVSAKLIPGALDEEGFILDYDDGEAVNLMQELIAYLFGIELEYGDDEGR